MIQMKAISDFKVFDLPVGAVGVGAVVGGVGDAVAGAAQGVIPQAPAWAVKLGLAYATYKFGPSVIGRDAANLGAMFLTYDGVQEVVNIRGNVRTFTSGILSKLPLPRVGVATTVTQAATTTNTAASAF
ncbi:hypothetical protein ABFB09_08040 [Dehalogenimonas sp. THU2]|uniref:hypothetical protein n=1 Tax=Dehalogenimonas sp. THU2 TaxID=3151121 RepID=UPI00321821FC